VAAPPLADNAYGIEYTQGPVLGSNRSVGLGGATSAISDCADGIPSTPASPAVRTFSSTRWFHFSLNGGLSFPGTYGHTDFENRGGLGQTQGSQTYNNFLHVGLGFSLAFGGFGTGLTVDVNNAEVRPATAGQSEINLSITTVRLPLAYAFWEKQVVVGVGIRSLALTLDGQAFSNRGTLFETSTQGWEAGVVLRPNEWRWRAMVTYRSETTDAKVEAPGGIVDSAGVQRVGGLVVPSRLTAPKEIETGFAVQFGERPINPTWVDTEEEKKKVLREVGRRDVARVADKNDAVQLAAPELREATAKAWDERNARAREADKAWADEETKRIENIPNERRLARRSRVLLLASVIALGPTTNNVAVSGFIDQTRQSVGQSWTLSPRAGVEFEAIENRLQIEGGSYLEPSRYAHVGPRYHFTTGTRTRLFEWSVFGIRPHTNFVLTTSLDFSTRDYWDWGLAVGLWE
jgi:hypothetical protein